MLLKLSLSIQRFVCLACICSIVVAQVVPAPPTFNETNRYSGANGGFKSHSGYPVCLYYPGLRIRYVVTVPAGQLAVLTIPATSPAVFSIRPYDFAVIYDGAAANRLQTPCSTASYAALGKNGIDFLPVLASATTVRNFTSGTNVVVCDLCVDPFDSGSRDMSRVGFQATWAAVADTRAAVVATVTTTPKPTTPKPTTATTTIPKPTTTIPKPTTTIPKPTTTTPPKPTCGAVQDDPSNNPNVRIVNGVQALPGSWPSTCALVKNGNFQFCGCTVIDKQWVLTAGHCCADPEALMVQTVQVFWGESDLTKCSVASGTIIPISRVKIHPSFTTAQTGATDFDVALIKLATPISASNPKFSPPCLPSQPISILPFAQVADSRRVCYVAGWGTLFQDQGFKGGKIGSGSDQLQQTSVEIFPQSECVADYPGITITNNMICGGYNNGNFDSCQGDSGSSMVCKQSDGSWALFGCVSWGSGCAQPGKPGIYANVFNFKSWITNTMSTN